MFEKLDILYEHPSDSIVIWQDFFLILSDREQGEREQEESEFLSGQFNLE